MRKIHLNPGHALDLNDNCALNIGLLSLKLYIFPAFQFLCVACLIFLEIEL